MAREIETRKGHFTALVLFVTRTIMFYFMQHIHAHRPTNILAPMKKKHVNSLITKKIIPLSFIAAEKITFLFSYWPDGQTDSSFNYMS